MRARPVLLEVSVCKPTAKSQFCETRKFLRRWKLKCSISRCVGDRTFLTTASLAVAGRRKFLPQNLVKVGEIGLQIDYIKLKVNWKLITKEYTHDKYVEDLKVPAMSHIHDHLRCTRHWQYDAKRRFPSR
ncbi:PREDICTED: uncharacterized protein LOC108375709 isoform X1 [Rhagoletis zephyria]|uniref:uncharacterized protein LOC108375709 isoform X1 n=1 Tax=Rhagoletis zephyria TaxID=28612 RepID=UPI000811A1CA|nr:PREDICTED: uncharacterized protein LOC108375709 isoform X1 [Rhagoletis zephyria]